MTIQRSVLTVSEINREITEALRKHLGLWNCWVNGEISNFKDHIPSGHWYFTLKDEAAGIRTVMFRTKAMMAGFKPQNGMKVLIRGSVRLYEKDGTVQLYAEEIYPSGLGALHIAYEQLKQKLAAEGLFAPERKKALPKYPAKIGIVTSPTGAAIRDILQIAARRNPRVSIIVIPSAVQGEAAPKEIRDAIMRANQITGIDLLIVGRGGGSLEELWAFNTEEVARAIAASAIPVISAVGHEIDYTIADFVADLRAPTPSAAAELAVPILADLQVDLIDYEEKLIRRIQDILARYRRQVEDFRISITHSKPRWKMEQSRQSLDYLSLRLQESMTGFMDDKNDILKLLSAKLDLLSPLHILAKGYSLTSDAEGHVVNTVTKLTPGQDVQVRLSDGKIDCTVNKIRCL